MAANNLVEVLMFMGIMVNVFRFGPFGVNSLSLQHYMMTCPLVEGVIMYTMDRALQSDPTLAAALLRMHFHDCFVEKGCDGSILIDSTKDNTAEKDSPANLSLRGYELIDQIKEELEKHCPGVVSCADILAMAAKNAVFFAGGPLYDIPKGRKDGRRSKIEDTIRLPPPVLNSSELIRLFGEHGFTAQEMVALSGAHTLGVSRCSSFKSRLQNCDTTHDVDPTLDAQFAKTLAKTCAGGDNAEQPFDSTKVTFDNDYYNAILGKAGVLFTDQTLTMDPRTGEIVYAYAMNEAMFFLDFAKAMVKMGLLDVKEGSNGEVRQSCRKIN